MYQGRKFPAATNKFIGTDGNCEVRATCSWQAVESLFCFFYSVGILSGKMAGFLISGLEGLFQTAQMYISGLNHLRTCLN